MPPSGEALIYSLRVTKSIANSCPNLLRGKELVAAGENRAGARKEIGQVEVDFHVAGSLIFRLR
jgi:hypothetical protein